jgi:hypothetical protein
MDEFLIVGRSHLDTPIYMSELSAQTLKDNGLQGDRTGLYLYEVSDEPASKGIRVLATVPNTDAVYRLLDMLGIREMV